MNETYEAREWEPWDQSPELMALQQEVEQGNEIVTVETVEGKEISLPLVDLIKAIVKWSRSYTQTNEAIQFDYIAYNKPITCIIKSWTPVIEKLQSFLRELMPTLYTGSIDQKITEELLESMRKYQNKCDDSNRFTYYSKNNLWEARFFHNPSVEPKLTYSLWVTVCPYTTADEIFVNTPQPTSLWSSDFFCNYINTHTENTRETEILTDKQTGNTYYTPDQDSIPIDWDNHWNIQRFLIEPHYRNVELSKEQAKLNVTYDLFKYYLFLHKWNREVAKSATLQLMKSEIEPIVNGYAEQRSHKYYEIYYYWYNLKYIHPNQENFCTPLNLFNNDLDDNGFLHKLLSYSIENPEKAPQPRETATFLIQYHISIRKKSPEESRVLSEKLCEKYILRYQNEITYTKNTINASQATKDKYIWIAEKKLTQLQSVRESIK